jgi:glycosyltransferase involved in cell wall biosynthesis
MSRPRVLFVSRTRYRLPLSPTLARKWDAVAAQLDFKVLAAGADAATGDGDFVLVPPARVRSFTGALFWLLLPVRVARLLRAFRPDAILTQSPYEAFAVLVARRLAGSRVPVATDVHGDWRTFTRLYGSPLRRSVRPFADSVAAASLRRVHAVRTVSPYTTRLVRELGVEPAATFPAITDLDEFSASAPVEPPAQPSAVFVGVLEAYKNVDGLAEAWRAVAARVPGATLHVVGKGSREDVVRSLAAELPGSVRWTRELDAAGVAAAIDLSSVLVLPSRSEGMGRVVIEAFCRARPVVGTRVGGIADLVEDGVNGLLVQPGSAGELADAIERILTEPRLAAELGRRAREGVEPWLQAPEEFAQRTRALVDDLLA